MSAYTLTVCHEGQTEATETVHFNSAPTAMDAIRGLLKKHPDCHRIRVHAGHTFLFAVDCAGATVNE